MTLNRYRDEVARTWLALENDPPASRVRELITCSPETDRQAEKHGWAVVLVNIAMGIWQAEKYR